jgi:hypothetical protein
VAIRETAMNGVGGTAPFSAPLGCCVVLGWDGMECCYVFMYVEEKDVLQLL